MVISSSWPFGSLRPPQKGTGFWPFVYPRPWDLKAEPGKPVVIDPVAIASETGRELVKAGWPGFGLMPRDFQMSILDADPANVSQMAEGWFEANRAAVADEILRRLPGYNPDRVSPSIKEAVEQAASAYREGKYLSVVRLLMPELERAARIMVTDRTARTSQAAAIKNFQELLRETPLIKEEPLETMSLFEYLDEHLFAACFTEADAAAFGGIPNRHAELHGLESYGHLRGASVILCALDLMLRFSARLLDHGHVRPSGHPVGP